MTNDEKKHFGLKGNELLEVLCFFEKIGFNQKLIAYPLENLGGAYCLYETIKNLLEGSQFLDFNTRYIYITFDEFIEYLKERIGEDFKIEYYDNVLRIIKDKTNVSYYGCCDFWDCACKWLVKWLCDKRIFDKELFLINLLHLVELTIETTNKNIKFDMQFILDNVKYAKNDPVLECTIEEVKENMNYNHNNLELMTNFKLVVLKYLDFVKAGAPIDIFEQGIDTVPTTARLLLQKPISKAFSVTANGLLQANHGCGKLFACYLYKKLSNDKQSAKIWVNNNLVGIYDERGINTLKDYLDDIEDIIIKKDKTLIYLQREFDELFENPEAFLKKITRESRIRL